MKRMILLILILVLVSCTNVKITDEIKETVDKVEETKEEIDNKTSIVKETIDKLTDDTYETPSVVTKRILKETGVETFGEVI